MSEFHVEVGAYALDALEDPRDIAFERHLAGCDTCRRELAEFSQTTALLSALGDVAPPRGLRGSLLDTIREVRPLPPEESTAPRDDDPAGSAAARSVDQLALRRQSRRSRWLAVAVAAVTVLALALGAWVQVVRSDQQIVAGQDAATTRLLSAADARTYPVTVGGAPATFVVSRSLGQAMFVCADLPTAAAGRTFQAWTVRRGEAAATPDVTFAGGSGTRIFLTGDLHQAVGLALSDEPRGGSAQPTRIITQLRL